MDLLGSILDSMEKPPSITEKERERIKKAKEARLQHQNKEKEKLRAFRLDVEKKVNNFEVDEKQIELLFPPCNRILRSIIHEVAQEADMVSYSIGEEEVDRHVAVYKKENVPSEDVLNVLRRGEACTEEEAKQLAQKRKQEKLDDEKYDKMKPEECIPASNYQTKYQHLIGSETAKDAARKTETNKKYGFVPSENKKDSRSIEQTLADIQSKKRMKKSEEN